ncbi:MAG: glycine cleavage system aminomethyltransferase GcvT [Ilumatobacteraceae bacterium]
MSPAGHSPLEDEHRSLGARLVPFGGWEMPVAYPSGTIDEHLACRHSCVVFDVSHLGTVRVEGPDALDRLQRAFTNDLGRIGPGRTQYTHLLDPVTASVTDDIIVWWVGEHQFDVMPNASNTAGVTEAIGGTDVTATRAVLAVQGPATRERLAGVFPSAAAVARNTVHELEWDGVRCTVAGTGYTGELGVEISVPADHAVRLWRALLEAGVLPAGLGARDTLRLEAGLPLHGHELGVGITPLPAGLGWGVAGSKPSFRGREALAAERERGVSRVLRGIATEGRRPPRAECDVVVDGRRVGALTSGNFSPVLGHGIALGFVDPDLPVGTAVQVDVRGSLLDGATVDLPFVRGSLFPRG